MATHRGQPHRGGRAVPQSEVANRQVALYTQLAVAWNVLSIRQLGAGPVVGPPHAARWVAPAGLQLQTAPRKTRSQAPVCSAQCLRAVVNDRLSGSVHTGQKAAKTRGNPRFGPTRISARAFGPGLTLTNTTGEKAALIGFSLVVRPKCVNSPTLLGEVGICRRPMRHMKKEVIWLIDCSEWGQFARPIG